MADLAEGALAQSIRAIWDRGKNDREMSRDSFLVVVTALDKINRDGCSRHPATCGRINRLEGWRLKVLGAFVGAGMVGGVVGWLIEKAWAAKEVLGK